MTTYFRRFPMERWIASGQIPEVQFPYSYSQSRVTYDWNGRRVLVAETGHRRYEVFEVPPEFLTFATSEQAEEWHRRFCTKSGPVTLTY